MKKLFSLITIALILCCTSVLLPACDGKLDKEHIIDYGQENSFDFEVTEDEDATIYMPTGVNPRYGLLFYVGTSITPKYYAYLAEPLAKQGYAVVISKVLLAYMMYLETEPAFEKYPNIEFFIGGHSQGGGAAVRRAQENSGSIKGVILFAPLCFGQDSIRDESVPTLLLEASNDGVLTDAMKADAKTRLPDDRTEYTLDGCHMSFSSFDGDVTLAMFRDGPVTAEVKAAQKRTTYERTLAFMRAVVCEDKDK